MREKFTPVVVNATDVNDDYSNILFSGVDIDNFSVQIKWAGVTASGEGSISIALVFSQSNDSNAFDDIESMDMTIDSETGSQTFVVTNFMASQFKVSMTSTPDYTAGTITFYIVGE
jgi:hypothetical protein